MAVSIRDTAQLVIAGAPRTRIRRTAKAAVAAAFLLIPATASAADVTIGSNLAGAANANICSQGISCTYVQTSSGTPVAVSPVAGQVVRWRLKAGSLGGEVKLRVLRPAGSGYAALASSTTVTVTSDLNTFTTSLPIAAGDVVALDNASSGLYFTNSPAIALPLVQYFQPAIADGTTAAPNNQRVNLELLMNADVTPAVPGVPGAPPPVATLPTPALSKLKLKPRTFRAARSGATVARKRPPIGTRVSYRLSVDATVAFRVERAKKGRRRGGKCRKPGRPSRGRRCTRYVRVRGAFNVGGTAGSNSFRFTGRVAKRKLAKGRYRLVATPNSGAKAGKATRARFRIK
jgi:hypothetical protein